MSPAPRWFRFRIRTLLVVTALAAVGCWLLQVLPGFAVFLIFLAGVVGILPPVIAGSRTDPPRGADAVLFPAAIAAAVGAEFYAARLAYYTLGEIDHALYTLSIALNLPAVGLLLGKRRRWAYAWLAALALWLVPYQLVLLAKWTVLDREARAVIAYVNAQKARTGRYPDDLRGFPLSPPFLGDQVRYRTDPDLGFSVSYHIGTWTTRHDYWPAHGWFYYPD